MLPSASTIKFLGGQAVRGFAAAAVFDWKVGGRRLGGLGHGWGGGLWSGKWINALRGLQIYREEINPPQAFKITH